MLFPFLTLNDGTEIVHSELIHKDDHDQVKVVIEKPVDGGFNSAVCWLPDYKWENIIGFSPDEINDLKELLSSISHVIIELAGDGGFEHATNF